MKVVVEGKIRGKQRPRVVKGHAFTPKETKDYENLVKMNYINQAGKYFLGPVRARIEAYYKIPKSYSKKRVQAIKEGKEEPIKKPDSDNIAKIILDSLNSTAYKDDAQVIELTVIKRYTERMERVEFEIEEL
ncbi:RusA family crossover junction endodeoxyribonuclease [Clostridium massiliamazoniense]|uniref:RusA family crossover junction endodeoxyribonuclease n=1 Tax=Clostridium massiliamazoniense TaxID=1347366 RepID=UPI0006D854E5|nr:RusA family crossover junction endodeoxyribonuclease [Clostridium massiliamazoniense]